MVNLKRIKELRILNNYTQNYLAEILDFKSLNLYNLKENGKRRFSIEELCKLAEEFEVDIKELIN